MSSVLCNISNNARHKSHAVIVITI